MSDAVEKFLCNLKRYGVFLMIRSIHERNSPGLLATDLAE